MQTENNIDSISLNEAEFEKKYKIIEIKDKQLQLKLMEMGCLPGMTVNKITGAPFGGPLFIKILPGAHLLAIRQEESREIILAEL